MTMDNEPEAIPAAAAEAAKPAVDAATETALTGVDAVANATTAAGDRAAGLAREAAAQGESAYAQGSARTTEAFDQARSRLQQMGMPGLDFGQAMLDQFRTGADQLSQRMSGGYGRTAQTIAEFNAKAVEAWRKNAEATITHWQTLAGVTNWSEMIALNTAHARNQIEAMTAQTRELAEIAGRIARDTTGTNKS